MARRKILVENRLYSFGGKRYKGIDLVDSLFLSGVEIKDIARILNVEEKKFISTYKSRLEDVEAVHRGLLVKAAFDKALNGDKAMLDTLLAKYQWLEKSNAGETFTDMLKELLNK